jgi:hypothetical protein
MTTFFKTVLVASAAALSLAGAAHAQDGVHIALTGKDAKTVHAEIVQAAHKVCRDSAAVVEDFSFSSEAGCVNDTVDKAEAEYRAAHYHAPVETAQLSSQGAGQ